MAPVDGVLTCATDASPLEKDFDRRVRTDALVHKGQVSIPQTDAMGSLHDLSVMTEVVDCLCEVVNSHDELNCLQSKPLLCQGRSNDLNGSAHCDGKRSSPHQYNLPSARRGNSYRGHVELMDSAYRMDYGVESALELFYWDTTSGLGAADWENMVGPGKDVYATSAKHGFGSRVRMVLDGWYHVHRFGNLSLCVALGVDFKATRHVKGKKRTRSMYGAEDWIHIAHTRLLLNSWDRMSESKPHGDYALKGCQQHSYERFGSEESCTWGEKGMVRTSRGVNVALVTGLPDGKAPMFAEECTFIHQWQLGVKGRLRHVVQVPQNGLDGCAASTLRSMSNTAVSDWCSVPNQVSGTLQESDSAWMVEGSCSVCWFAQETDVSCVGFVALSVDPVGEPVEANALRCFGFDVWTERDTWGALPVRDVCIETSMTGVYGKAVVELAKRLSANGMSVPCSHSDCAGPEVPLLNGSSVVLPCLVPFDCVKWCTMAKMIGFAVDVLPMVMFSCLTRLVVYCVWQRGWWYGEVGA